MLLLRESKRGFGLEGLSPSNNNSSLAIYG